MHTNLIMRQGLVDDADNLVVWLARNGIEGTLQLTIAVSPKLDLDELGELLQEFSAAFPKRRNAPDELAETPCDDWDEEAF